MSDLEPRVSNNALLRGLAAAAVLVSADVHFQLWQTGYRSIHVLGTLFLLNAIGGLVIVLLLLLTRNPLPLLLSFGFGVLTLAGFLVSHYHGLYGVKEPFMGTAVWQAFAAEIAAIVFSLLAMGRWFTVRRSNHAVAVA